MYLYTNNDLKRFKEKIFINSETQCLEWRGTATKEGGKFWLNGKSIAAHKFAYFINTNDSISTNIIILHSCNNKLCVNINHLKISPPKIGINNTYRCAQCHIYKSKDSFCSNKSSRHGIGHTCKECMQQHRNNMPENKKQELKQKKKAYDITYRDKNRERIKRYLKNWRLDNSQYMNEYRKQNKDKIKSQNYIYQQNIKKKNEKMDKLYFIAAENEAIKIGYTSTDPIYRMKTLQTGYYKDFILLGVMFGNKIDEAKIHKQFAH